jgi:HlyD family secretion protein
MNLHVHSLIALSFTFLLAACNGNNRDTIEASGTIEGTDINVAAEVNGKIKAVLVDEGRQVRAGDTLLLISDAEYQIQLRSAQANQSSYESAYRLAVEGSRREDVRQAEVALKTAQTDYQRMKTLLESGSITQKQYDDAYTRYVTAEQTHRKLATGLRPEEIQGAKDRWDYATAQTDLLKKKVHDCTVVAPSNAVVTLRGVEPGEFVTTGMTVIRLTALERVKLMIYVNETDLPRIQLGQKAMVKTDGGSREAEGNVVFISPTAEFTPKNVQTKEERTKLVFGVKIEADNADGTLKPGLPADVRILAPSHP